MKKSDLEWSAAELRTIRGKRPKKHSTKKRKQPQALALDDRPDLQRRIAELEARQPTRQEAAIRVLRARYRLQVLQILYRDEHAFALVDGRPLPLVDQVALNEDAARSGIAKLSGVLSRELGRIREAWETRR